MKHIYMINEIVDKYRWIGLPESDEDLGIRLAKVKFDPIKANFDSIKVEWLPETYDRPVCDFPNFRPQFTCFSEKAIDCLKPLIGEAGEFIKLYGIEVYYEVFHCLTVYDALDVEAVEELKDLDTHFSIYSPNSVLPLTFGEDMGAHIFHVPEVKTKFFVSEEFKDIYEKNKLCGLSFVQVPC